MHSSCAFVQKGAGLHEYQQSMVYHIEVTISTSPFIKGGQDNLVREEGSQEPVKALGVSYVDQAT